MTEDEGARRLHCLKECGGQELFCPLGSSSMTKVEVVRHLDSLKDWDAQELFLTFADGGIFGGMLPVTAKVGNKGLRNS